MAEPAMVEPATEPEPAMEPEPTAEAEPTTNDEPPSADQTVVARQRDESRVFALERSPPPAPPELEEDPAPHYRWPAEGDVEMRAYGEGPHEIRVAIADVEHRAFIAHDMPSVYGAVGGARRIGELIVAWILRPEGPALDAAVLRASDGSVIGEPVQVWVRTIARDHDCSITVCESWAVPVLDGERLSVLVMYEGGTLFENARPRGRAVELPIPLVMGIERRPEHDVWTLTREGARITLVPPAT